MCFSASASFSAAAVLAIIGGATLAQKPEPKRLAFGLIPLIFAGHQAIEGTIWLSFNQGAAPPAALVGFYLFIAQVFWPVYTPLSVLLLEEEKRRRWALFILLGAGAIVSVSLLVVLLREPYTVSVFQHNLRYATEYEFERRLLGLYLLTTTAPFLLSGHRYIMAFGGATLIGSFITLFFFYEASVSVWCFFAAISSIFVFLHIRRRNLLAT